MGYFDQTFNLNNKQNPIWLLLGFQNLKNIKIKTSAVEKRYFAHNDGVAGSSPAFSTNI